MKKVLFFLSFLCATALFLGCSNDEDEISKKDLLGTWVVQSVETEKGDKLDLTHSYVIREYGKTYATFYGDGSYKGGGFFGNGKGTYKTKGKTVITYIEGTEYFSYDIQEMTSTKSTLKMYRAAENGYFILKCIKESSF